MPESTLVKTIVGISASIVGAAVIGCATAMWNTNAHLAKIDVVLETQTRILDTLPTKLDGMATTPIVEKALSELRTRLNDQQVQINACRDDKTTIEKNAQEMRGGLQKQIDRNAEDIKARTGNRWTAVDMDRWASLAEKRIGKPLPTVNEVTGHNPYENTTVPSTP